MFYSFNNNKWIKKDQIDDECYEFVLQCVKSTTGHMTKIRTNIFFFTFLFVLGR